MPRSPHYQADVRLATLVVRSRLLPPAHPTRPAFGGAHASVPTAAHVPMEPFRYHVAQLTTRPPAMVDRCWPSAVDM
ncbi:hypothetical protein K439DRAFT_1631018 [Ramaria rubella]|nr:hypothetical protein K439DRAFT_1631018 [Ramaria rubella]